MEIAICRLFRDPAKRDSRKALYLAPLKSLCAEKAADWTSRYARCGLRCAEIVGGDTSSGASEEARTAGQAISQSHIVCATPEKFVATARGLSLSNSDTLLGSIGLVLIDECHMVGTSRGASLELTISLIRNQARVIAASATVGNIGDIAEWLADRSSEPTNMSELTQAKTLVFGDEYRPVPLTKVVLGYDCTGPYYQFQRNLDFKLDRSRVEQLFINGAVQLLCSTSTLGIGVNMPAYMVIVKGTKGYADNNYEEYAKSEILQFIGRAGRPQFGPSGKAIILTERTMVSSYQNLVSGSEILESSLSPELARWILGSVYRQEFITTNDVAQWLSFSFLAVRVKKNPLKYIESNDLQRVSEGDYCNCIAEREIARLEAAGLLSVTRDGRLAVTVLGGCMAKHKVDPIRMADIASKLPKSPSYQHILEAICGCGEFDNFRITAGQKGVLNDLNKSPWVRFKLAGRVQSIGDKVLVLLQYGLSCKSLPASNHAPGLGNDMNRIIQIAQGLAMCARECYVERGDVAGVANSTILCRELVAKCAEDSSALLQQIDGVGPRYAELLWSQGIASISQLCDTGAREIERVSSMA
ncbi:ATP-dependent DNA helicase MER3 [Coemansia sp. RSA 2424]|nr:ATP-dependent DNA helicase MER3 [Coemansia sp. RSA 2424]